MSKRRTAKQPNLPSETLARARQQAGLPVESGEAGAERKSSRRRISDAQIERSRQRSDVDYDFVADALANPTKIVSEEELRKDYGHVLVDLRNMGLLSAVLMIVLVLLAQFI